jgi:hypothetical protein
VTGRGVTIIRVIAGLRSRPGSALLARAWWVGSIAGCRGPGPPWAGGTSDFLAADAARGPADRLAIADLLLCPPGACSGTMRETLRGNPGCILAVATIPARGCLAVTREEAVMLTGPGAQVPRGGLAVAALAYGWIAAGFPLAGLSPGQLAVTSASSGWSAPGLVLLSVSLSVRYEPVGSGSRPAIR